MMILNAEQLFVKLLRLGYYINIQNHNVQNLVKMNQFLNTLLK